MSVRFQRSHRVLHSDEVDAHSFVFGASRAAGWEKLHALPERAPGSKGRVDPKRSMRIPAEAMMHGEGCDAVILRIDNHHVRRCPSAGHEPWHRREAPRRSSCPGNGGRSPARRAVRRGRQERGRFPASPERRPPAEHGRQKACDSRQSPLSGCRRPGSRQPPIASCPARPASAESCRKLGRRMGRHPRIPHLGRMSRRPGRV